MWGIISKGFKDGLVSNIDVPKYLEDIPCAFQRVMLTPVKREHKRSAT